jgi:hypothetical protein
MTFRKFLVPQTEKKEGKRKERNKIKLKKILIVIFTEM